jgi:cytochrome P450
LLNKERKKEKKGRKKRKEKEERKRSHKFYFAQNFLSFAIDPIGWKWVRKVVIEDLTLRRVVRFKPNLAGIKQRVVESKLPT